MTNTCDYCGTNPVDTSFGNTDSHYCTACKPIHDKMKKSHHKRAKKYNLPYTRFTPSEIFERDYWFCHICWKVCSSEWDPTPGAQNPDYATLDHIIPLAYQTPNHPGHVPTNVHTVCMSCNSDKGARVEGEVYCCKSFRDTGSHNKRCHVLTRDNVQS